MRVYHNDVDAEPAEWTRHLMSMGAIRQGTVSQKSIEDVHGYELEDYERCHFFSGIAGWEHALDLAGWPEGRLNPAHSRWLMGFPVVWDYCGVMAMQYLRKSAQRS